MRRIGIDFHWTRLGNARIACSRMEDQYCAEWRDGKSLKSRESRSPNCHYDRICANLPRRPILYGLIAINPTALHANGIARKR
jgi:hypothetical protein